MYKIGILGDRDSVLGFMALGFSVHDVSLAEEARTELHAMVKSDEYAIIFVTEKIAQQIEDEIIKYKDIPLPAIVSVPGSDGATGYGIANIRSAVEKAVGADILFKE